MSLIFSLEGREFQGISDDYEEHVVGELGNAFSIAFTACIRDSESWSPFVRLDALQGTDIIMIACHQNSTLMEVHFIQGDRVTRLEARGVKDMEMARWLLTVDSHGLANLYKDGRNVGSSRVGLPSVCPRKVTIAKKLDKPPLSFQGVLKDIVAFDGVVSFEDAVATAVVLTVDKTDGGELLVHRVDGQHVCTLPFDPEMPTCNFRDAVASQIPETRFELIIAKSGERLSKDGVIKEFWA